MRLKMGNSILRGMLGFLIGQIPAYIKLIFATSLISVIALIVGAFYPGIFEYIALKPSLIIQGKHLWTLVTHMFVHGSILHLFVNMFSMFFIGRIVEQIIGRRRFIWFYFISGIIAGGVSVLLAGFFGFGVFERVFGSPDVIMLGASGALFGLLGILALLLPNKKVILFAGPLIVIVLQVFAGSFLQEGALFTIIMLALNLVLIMMILALIFPFGLFARWAVPIPMPLWLAPVIAIVPLTAISFFVALPIGNTAHFFGLVAGLVYGVYLRVKYARKVVMLDKMFK